VKTNIVHTLHRVKAFGGQSLENFKEMLTPDEYRKCESNLQLGKTLFNLTTDVFISFLFWVSDFLATIMIAPQITSNDFDVCPSHSVAARDFEGL
jgi:hypothetical protein